MDCLKIDFAYDIVIDILAKKKEEVLLWYDTSADLSLDDMVKSLTCRCT
jgi:hypothetical protein